MAHGVYDKRGNLVLKSDSEMECFVRAREYQRAGQLATVILDGRDEVLFAPRLTGAATGRAPTAVEVEARAEREPLQIEGAVVKSDA